MSKLPVVKPAQVIKALQRAGFQVVRQRGSHVQLKLGQKLVTVPFHNRDIPKGTLKSIMTQAGLTISEFQSIM